MFKLIHALRVLVAEALLGKGTGLQSSNGLEDLQNIKAVNINSVVAAWYFLWIVNEVKINKSAKIVFTKPLGECWKLYGQLKQTKSLGLFIWYQI